MEIRLAVFAVKKIREGFPLFQIITGPLFTLMENYYSPSI